MQQQKRNTMPPINLLNVGDVRLVGMHLGLGQMIEDYKQSSQSKNAERQPRRS